MKKDKDALVKSWQRANHIFVLQFVIDFSTENVSAERDVTHGVVADLIDRVQRLEQQNEPKGKNNF